MSGDAMGVVSFSNKGGKKEQRRLETVRLYAHQFCSCLMLHGRLKKVCQLSESWACGATSTTAVAYTCTISEKTHPPSIASRRLGKLLHGVLVEAYELSQIHREGSVCVLAEWVHAQNDFQAAHKNGETQRV